MGMSYIHGDFMTHEINEHRFLLFHGSWNLASCNVFNFMGQEISRVTVFEIFMPHEIHFQGFSTFLMVTFHGKIMTSKPTMKIWISVFMGMKNRFMGFSEGFHGIFIVKWFIVKVEFELVLQNMPIVRPLGISNPFYGRSMDIFWSHTFS